MSHLNSQFPVGGQTPNRVEQRGVRLSAVLVLALVQLAFSPLVALADWPSFRGPWSDGHVAAPGGAKTIGLPLHWSDTNNVKWQIEIPYRGWSTPALMAGQVWLTTAPLDGHDFFVICVDAETGNVLLNEKVFHCDNPESLYNAAGVNCYATPSPVIEPGRVYVHFGTYGTACLDTKTLKVLWERKDLPCRHYRGPASSPFLFENLLILTFDGVDVQYLVALDKKTGQNVWKTNRSVAWNDEDDPTPMVRDGDRRKAHSTPVLITVNGQRQLLSGGAKAAYAYDPRTGRELWRVRYNAWSAAPMPLYQDGLAFFISGLGKTELLAVRVDGQGDVTDTHIAWRTESLVAKTASPILVDGLLYMVTDDGVVSCREPKTGEQVWRGSIGGKYAASPIYADGRLYFSNQQGKTTVLKPGRALEIAGTNTLSGGFMASPAVAGNALYLRTKTHLARVEETGNK
jgi:outer membrane protein assembly factor BamB